MPIYYNILVAEFLAREHGPVLFWLILPWNSHYLSLEEAEGGGGGCRGILGRSHDFLEKWRGNQPSLIE